MRYVDLRADVDALQPGLHLLRPFRVQGLGFGGFEEGPYSSLIDACITQLKAGE